MADQKDSATKEDLRNLREDVKADLKDFKEEIIHRFHIISEDHLTEIKQLAEGISNLYEKSERDKAELKSEMRETRQEILAAVKFSYAELDRRLTTLENEFLELKRRVEKIESHSVPKFSFPFEDNSASLYLKC